MTLPRHTFHAVLLAVLAGCAVAVALQFARRLPSGGGAPAAPSARSYPFLVPASELPAPATMASAATSGTARSGNLSTQTLSLVHESTPPAPTSARIPDGMAADASGQNGPTTASLSTQAPAAVALPGQAGPADRAGASQADIEKALARERQIASDILKYHGKGAVQADIVEDSEALPEDAADAPGATAPGKTPASPDKVDQDIVERLAQIAGSDDTDAGKIKIYQEALEPCCPVAVRVQALHLLYDLAPNQVSPFLQDSNEVVRLEAERLLSGIKNP